MGYSIDAGSANAAAPALDELVAMRELQSGLGNIFPSMGSLTWHLRQHRTEYIGAGAVYVIAGRMMAHPPTFKRVALAIGARAAAATTASV